MSCNEVIMKILAYDRPGALDKIAGLIRRRGWNIESLTAGDVGGGVTQVCISMSGPDVSSSVLGERLSELDAIQRWQECGNSTHIIRETVLFQISNDETCIAEMDGIRVLDRRDGALYMEYSGTPDEVNILLSTMHGHMISCVRSGPIAIEIGKVLCHGKDI